MSALDEDLAFMLGDPALEPVTIQCAGQETSGLFDDSDVVALAGLEPGESMQLQERKVRVRTGTLAGLVRHVAITLVKPDGTSKSYLARDILRIDDGRETLVTLVEP